MMLSNTTGGDLVPNGFGTEQHKFKSLNRRSFDVNDSPCNLDGGREQNNAVVCNCYVICSDK